MFLLFKIKTIFFIIAIFRKMYYKFKNKVVLKVSEKLVIPVMNLFVYYLIIEVSYARLLLII